MSYPRWIDLENKRICTESGLQPSQFILMQFTGLKDCKGTDIYDGDIFLPRYNGLRPMEVKYCGGSYNIAAYMVKSCEIIGNKYENPEKLG